MVEGFDQGRSALIDSAVEAVIGRGFLGDIPDPLDAAQLRRISWQTEQVDTVPMVVEPSRTILFEPVAGAVSTMRKAPLDLRREVAERRRTAQSCGPN